MIKVHYGRENIDKDRFLYNSIEGETIVIVPDQFTLQAERDAFFYLEGQEGFMDLEIIGFSRLGTRVLQELGGGLRPMIDKEGRHMLLTKILKSMDSSEDGLEIYKGYSRDKEFIEMANNLISQMKQEGVRPEDLTEKIESLDKNSFLYKKLTDIQGIFAKYEEAIEGKYVDTEDHVSLYAEKILQSEKLKSKAIWVYSFDYLTPKNLLVIQNLAIVAREVNLVITWDPESNQEVFTLGKYLTSQLKDLAQAIGVPFNCQPVPSTYIYEKPPALMAVESQLFSIPAEMSSENNGITLVQGANYYSEGATAAAKVRSLIMDKGYLLREIALICNDLEVRGSIYKRVFAQYGIDVFLDKKRDIMHSPAPAFVAALLDGITLGYRGDHIMAMLKTGLWEIDPDQVEELENYVRLYNISGKQWRQPFVKGMTVYTADEINNLEGLRRQVMEQILPFAESFKEGKTVISKVTCLYDFLSKTLDLDSKLERLIKDQMDSGNNEGAGETAQTWNIIVKILDQLVTILGEQQISMKDFSDLVKAGLEAVEIGILPPTLDGLIMGTTQRSRNSRIKAVLVLGASEGLFPAQVTSEGLLTEEELSLVNQDRAICKADKLRMEEENLAIYKIMSKPTEELWLSYSVSDESGKGQNPSHIFETIGEIFQIKADMDVENTKNPSDLIGGKQSTLNHVATAMRGYINGQPVADPIWEAVVWYRDKDPESYKGLVNSLEFKNIAKDLEPDRAAALYLPSSGTAFSFSPSRLEKFGRCPFSHFINYGLRPTNTRVYQMDALDMGDLYHKCLMIFSQNLTEDGKAINQEDSPWMTVTREECQAMIKQILIDEGEDHREGIFTGGPEEDYRLSRMTDICCNVGWQMVEQVRAGNINEMYFETPFGRNGDFPPIEVDYKGQKIFVEGKIDRVDILNGGAAKVIDYKSGSDKYSQAEATSGWKLQLLVYLAAVAGSGKSPAAAFYFHIKEPLLDMSNGDKGKIMSSIDEAIKKEFKMDGVMVNDEGVIDSIAGEFTGDSKIAPVSLKSSGEFYSRSKDKLLEREDFDQLITSVVDQVKVMCNQIASGKIAIEPKKTSNMTACKYCQYKGICKFDMAMEECRYTQI